MLQCVSLAGSDPWLVLVCGGVEGVRVNRWKECIGGKSVGADGVMQHTECGDFF